MQKVHRVWEDLLETTWFTYVVTLKIPSNTFSPISRRVWTSFCKRPFTVRILVSYHQLFPFSVVAYGRFDYIIQYFDRHVLASSGNKMRLKIIASLFYKNLLKKSGRIRHLCLIGGLCCNHQNIVLNSLLRISLYSWSRKYGPFRLNLRNFANIWDIIWNRIRSMKFETVWILF